MTAVGVIGLGNIGGAVAANLVADGHAVAVYDTDPARAAALAGKGATAVASVAAVAAASTVTFTSLPSPRVFEAVAGAWLGAAAAVARVSPLLERLGRATFHVGGLGLGNVAKLVNSLMAFSATWLSLEGLAVAAKAGIDVRTMIDVIRSGGAGNMFTDRMVEGINERGRPTQFSLALAAKDAGRLLDVAREYGVPTPAAAQVAQAFVAAVGASLGERDCTDIVEVIEPLAGVELRIAPPKC
jgi:3-hydroxyisobutyrate dehydrogenase-like beta-hydroxyacid dehydrogenase